MLADAIADVEIALRLADRTGPGTPAEQFATGTLIEALLARGDVDRAVAVCGDREYGTSLADAMVLPLPNAVRGAVQLARGQTATAAATLRRVGQWLEHACLLNPSVCSWRFDLGRALRHSAPDQAREVVAVGMRQADRFGSARALRTLAALQPDSAAEPLEEAVRILRPTPHRLEQAHALAELGAALAKNDRDARALWSEALTLADECGALSLGNAIARRLDDGDRSGRHVGAPPTEAVVPPRCAPALFSSSCPAAR